MLWGGSWLFHRSHKASPLTFKWTSVISSFLFINNCYASAIFARTFHLLQRQPWACYLSFWLPVQPCHSFLFQLPIFVCQSIRHLPILLEDLQTLDEITSFITLWDEEGEIFWDSWITLWQYQQVVSSVTWNLRRERWFFWRKQWHCQDRGRSMSITDSFKSSVTGSPPQSWLLVWTSLTLCPRAIRPVLTSRAHT